MEFIFRPQNGSEVNIGQVISSRQAKQLEVGETYEHPDHGEIKVTDLELKITSILPNSGFKGLIIAKYYQTNLEDSQVGIVGRDPDTLKSEMVPMHRYRKKPAQELAYELGR